MTWPPHPAGGGRPDIAQDLRHRILSLDLLPGASLSRAALGARYGISSTPLRDALLRLRDERLITVHPQSRTTVSLIDIDHARQIHVLRSSVEAEIAARLARQPSPDLIDELRSLIALQTAEAGSGAIAGFAQLDLAFHHALFRQTGLEEVWHVIRRESVHIDRLRALHLMRPEKMQQILDDHRAICAAIAQGAPEAAAQAMQTHLSQSILYGQRLTEERPEFFKTA
ncbi:MAG: GntR family transcriptional regulator [Paracoccus sp. (in: a-proteobacteria)]